MAGDGTLPGVEAAAVVLAQVLGVAGELSRDVLLLERYRPQKFLYLAFSASLKVGNSSGGDAT